MSQKIVIPKGLINPNETTIIEIPEDIQNVETVIAKPFFVQNEYEYDYGYEQYTMEPTVRYIEEDIEEYCETLEELDGPEFPPCSHYPKRKIYKNHQQINYMNPIYNNVNIPIYNKSWKNTGDMHKIQTNLQTTECNTSNILLRKPPIAKNKIALLDAMDKAEFRKLHQNLIEYQAARRKLLFETANVYSVEDVSANLLKY